MAGWRRFIPAGLTLWRGGDCARLWFISLYSVSPPELGRDASGLPRPNLVVLFDGFSSWRGVDAGAGSTPLAFCWARRAYTRGAPASGKHGQPRMVVGGYRGA